MNSKKKWKQIQPYSTNIGSESDRLWYRIFGATTDAVFPTNKQLNSISSKYSIPIGTLEQWIQYSKKPDPDPSMNFYACDINEHQSRLTQFKHAMNLDTSDKITKEHMLTAIKLTPDNLINNANYQYWKYILICWTRNSMTDINQYIDWLNQELIVKNQKQKIKLNYKPGDLQIT